MNRLRQWWQWLLYSEDKTQALLLRLEKEIMALSPEVVALQAVVNGLGATVDAAVAALGTPKMSAEDSAAITQAGTAASAFAQKLAAATPPVPAPPV